MHRSLKVQNGDKPLFGKDGTLTPITGNIANAVLMEEMEFPYLEFTKVWQPLEQQDEEAGSDTCRQYYNNNSEESEEVYEESEASLWFHNQGCWRNGP